MTYTTRPVDPFLDLPAWRGQRVETFRFQLINGVTGEHKGFVTPQRDQSPSLSHSTTQTTKRQLSLVLGVADTAKVVPLTDRILPFMVIGRAEYPLGRYMFTGDAEALSTGGTRGSFTLVDEGFIVDQSLEHATTTVGSVNHAIVDLLTGLPLGGRVLIDASPFQTKTIFAAGQSRGQALETYATQGDYFPFWFDNDGDMRMVRSIDPALAVVDFDFDASKKVLRDSPVDESDILTAPNKFIVISSSGDADVAEIIGSYEVPPSAPHSIAKRGFTIPDIRDLQAADATQAAAMARNIGLRATVFERVTLTTSLDPRHDSYDVIRWQGENWLEMAWSMELTAGGQMQHTLRKAYAP